ncbi:MAG TPA: DUF5615 family PIN-like protein [Bryobacteraceae bacterium]|nr:DUF5615 family PIN-like protein [Bryobacteraceae bacterium]
MRWLADENFNNDILRALFRRDPTIDILRVQDVGLGGVDDPTLLAWAAETTRLLLTHDVSTITAYAYERVRDGKRMPGVFEVGRDVPILVAVEDILLITECSHPEEWDGQVRYLPLR